MAVLWPKIAITRMCCDDAPASLTRARLATHRLMAFHRGAHPPSSALPHSSSLSTLPTWTHQTPRGGPLTRDFGPPTQVPRSPGLNPHFIAAPPRPPHGVLVGDMRGLLRVPYNQPPFSPHYFTPEFRTPFIAPQMGPIFHTMSPYTPQPGSLQTLPLLGVSGGMYAPWGPNIPQTPPPQAADPADVFLQEWLAAVKARSEERESTASEDRPMKIPEVRGLLFHALCLLSSLTECHTQLSQKLREGDRGEQCAAILTQAHKWQKELLDIRELVDRGDNVERLGRKLAGIKRERVKVKAGVKRRRREREEERERSEQKAKQWVQQKRKEKLKEETERSVQSDASGVLGEVKRKLSDVQYYTKFLNSLTELREFRREAHRKTGEPLVKEDEVFAAKSESLAELLKERVKLYEEEEHALRVMIQEEVEERMLAESAAVSTGVVGNSDRQAEREGGEGPVDPAQPFLDYYLQAERSVEALIDIRKSWDMYLSAEGTPVPRQLPQFTAPEPSGVWSHYCTSETV